MESLWNLLLVTLISIVINGCLIGAHQNTFEGVVNPDADPAAQPPAPHVHHGHAKPVDPSRFNRNHIQNQDHILEHLDGVINKPEGEMSEEELQFHYFKLHDYDNNSQLDGIEIIDAMTHYHKGEDPQDHEPPARIPDEELISVVDQIMADEDLNNDGYIGYSEFVAAQRAQEAPTQT